MINNSEIHLDHLAEHTYSAVYSDVCDKAELRQQTLGSGVHHLAGNKGVLIGWARTALSMPVNAIPERPYWGEIEFVDSLNPGDVVVLDCSRRDAAGWGELFSTAAAGRGARGAIVDGLIRDSSKIDDLKQFPVYGRGARPTDSLGRVAIQEWDRPVSVFGTPVSSGDLIVADKDGVTVVPKDRADEIIAMALEKATTENSARELLLSGGYLRDVWEKYRVL